MNEFAPASRVNSDLHELITKCFTTNSLYPHNDDSLEELVSRICNYFRDRRNRKVSTFIIETPAFTVKQLQNSTKIAKDKLYRSLRTLEELNILTRKRARIMDPVGPPT